MSRNTVDVYALIEGRGPDAELVVWFDLGGAFLSSEMHPTRFPYADKILSDMVLLFLNISPDAISLLKTSISI